MSDRTQPARPGSGIVGLTAVYRVEPGPLGSSAWERYDATARAFRLAEQHADTEIVNVRANEVAWGHGMITGREFDSRLRRLIATQASLELARLANQDAFNAWAAAIDTDLGIDVAVPEDA